MKNIFEISVTKEIIERLDKLTAESKPDWGKMNAGQLMAHLCVAYEYVYTDIHTATKPKGFKKFLLKAFVKNAVVSDKPYKKNGRTGPDFLISEEKDFSKEKTRLIEFINKAQQDGESKFDGMESHSFGKLTAKEWNNSFYKHLDHHLTQFGV